MPSYMTAGDKTTDRQFKKTFPKLILFKFDLNPILPGSFMFSSSIGLDIIKISTSTISKYNCCFIQSLWLLF